MIAVIQVIGDNMWNNKLSPISEKKEKVGICTIQTREQTAAIFALQPLMTKEEMSKQVNRSLDRPDWDYTVIFPK